MYDSPIARPPDQSFLEKEEDLTLNWNPQATPSTNNSFSAESGNKDSKNCYNNNFYDKDNGNNDSCSNPGTSQIRFSSDSIAPRSYNGEFEKISRAEITPFRVYARVRSFIREELERMPPLEPLRSIVEMVDTSTILLDPHNNWAPVRQYDFDNSFWSIPSSQKLVMTYTDTKTIRCYDSQKRIYAEVGEPCVNDAFEGFNSCILAYGMTSSGKTYTMMGNYDIHKGADENEKGEEGIIPRVCADLFWRLQHVKEEGRETRERSASGQMHRLNSSVGGGEGGSKQQLKSMDQEQHQCHYNSQQGWEKEADRDSKGGDFQQNGKNIRNSLSQNNSTVNYNGSGMNNSNEKIYSASPSPYKTMGNYNENKADDWLSLAEEERRRNATVEYRVECTFVEIYLEKVRDLLGKTIIGNKGEVMMTNAKVRENPIYGPFVEGITKYKVENWTQCCKLLERGSKHRTTCATNIHDQSSRSHAVFQLTIVKTVTFPQRDRYTPAEVRINAAHINLVDLAGSERGGMTDYVKESSKINKSLLVLRRVIDTLTERQQGIMNMMRDELQGIDTSERQRQFLQVPYRDSVLTWLLKGSIGGNARTAMIATLSPLKENYVDTFSTLSWSSKARNLVTVVSKNQQVHSCFTGKKEELESMLLIQQHNVDSLRQFLNSMNEQTRDYRVLNVSLEKRVMWVMRFREMLQRYAHIQSEARRVILGLTSFFDIINGWNKKKEKYIVHMKNYTTNAINTKEMKAKEREVSVAERAEVLVSVEALRNKKEQLMKKKETLEKSLAKSRA